MKFAHVVLLIIGISSMALADFSYTATIKWTRLPVPQVVKHYLKGQKMKSESAGSSTILDFDAHTITRINNLLKLYSATKLSDISIPPRQTEVEVTVYVQETGRTRSIDGYDANEVLLTADMDSPQIRQMPVKVQTERRLWISMGVPGSEQRRAFYDRNREVYPWGVLTDREQEHFSNAASQAVWEAAAEMERRKSELKGVPVLEVFTLRSAAGGLKGPNTQDWAQARAQLEEQRSKGGPGADSAVQALARADSMGGDPFATMQYTQESSGFSTEPIPDSVFAIPAGYTLVSAAELANRLTEAARSKLPAGTNGGVIGGIIGSVDTRTPAPAEPGSVHRIRVGGNVAPAKLISQAKPVYPPLARQARVSGHVLFDVIINKDGTIQNIQLISGHPVLVPAAMEAVKQWVYQPTLLNGAPVEVVTKVDVNFTLGDDPRPLPSALVGQHYRELLPAAGPVSSGVQTWALVTGNLPAGLSLDATTGAISGEPSAAGDFTFGVHVTNGADEATVSLSIHVDPAR
jgi:TonB family protein